MVNKIWFFFIVVGIITSLFNRNISIINDEILSCGKTTIDMIIKIFPVMALWLGIMKITLDSGLLTKLVKLINPILKKIFPEIPKNHEAMGYMSSNIIANMLGLGNVATPFGIKAMKSLQELNKDKKTASKSMITFLLLNTSGLTIIPTTIISMRMFHNSTNPTSIVLACIISTTISTIISIIIDKIYRRKNDF